MNLVTKVNAVSRVVQAQEENTGNQAQMASRIEQVREEIQAVELLNLTII
jgi:hypothetical protein